MIATIPEIELQQMITIDRLAHCPLEMENMYINRMAMLKNMEIDVRKEMAHA